MHTHTHTLTIYMFDIKCVFTMIGHTIPKKKKIHD